MMLLYSALILLYKMPKNIFDNALKPAFQNVASLAISAKKIAQKPSYNKPGNDGGDQSNNDLWAMMGKYRSECVGCFCLVHNSFFLLVKASDFRFNHTHMVTK